MPELLLLVGDSAKARNDNHIRLPEAFRRAGWDVTVADHDAVELSAGRLLLAGSPPDQFDLIWPLGFGRQVTFFDRMQLLKSLPGRSFVSSPDALVWLHGKHRWLDLMPETHTSARADTLLDVVTSGGDWILKPPAGSYGRDVHLIRAGAVSRAEIQSLLAAAAGGYLMAQRYLPDIRHGEQRTLVAGGRIIGTYTRLPGTGVTSNLATGGRPERGALTPAQRALVAPIARDLAEQGAGFAAVDTVSEYLMEVNVANPGGLETLETLEGTDHSDAVVQAIFRWKRLG